MRVLLPSLIEESKKCRACGTSLTSLYFDSNSTGYMLVCSNSSCCLHNNPQGFHAEARTNYKALERLFEK